MQNRKKEILSLLLAGTIVISASGCSRKDKIGTVYNEETNQTMYIGSIRYNNLKRIYIAKIETLNGEYRYHLLRTDDFYSSDFRDLDTNQVIIEKNSEALYTSYGSLKSLVPIKEYIIEKMGIQDDYDLEDIRNIFKCIVNDYDKETKNLGLKTE